MKTEAMRTSNFRNILRSMQTKEPDPELRAQALVYHTARIRRREGIDWWAEGDERPDPSPQPPSSPAKPKLSERARVARDAQAYVDAYPLACWKEIFRAVDNSYKDASAMNTQMCGLISRTPPKVIVARAVKLFFSENPGASWSDAHARVENHYGTVGTMRDQVTKVGAV